MADSTSLLQGAAETGRAFSFLFLNKAHTWSGLTLTEDMGDWMPRVLILPSSLYSRHRTIGGGERYALEYARALARHVPTTLGLFDLTDSVARDASLEIRNFPLRNFSDQWGFPATPAAFRAMGAFDVVHIMCFPTSLSEAAVLLARWRKQISVLTDVGGGGRSLSGYLGRISSRIDLHRCADGLAHLSGYAGTFFGSWKHPQTVLYGGADCDSVVAPFTGGHALFVGRLLPHKGILNVIRALDAATPLRVVGRPYDMGYFDQLRAEASGKQITFVTDASDADIRREYAEASVVLQPSIPRPSEAGDKSELLGLVALEGMAAGRPVVVTRTTSLPELVVDGETGFVVPANDLEALGSRIRQLVGNPILAEQMGRKAREHVRTNFSWDTVALRGLTFYRSLQASGRGRASLTPR